MTYMAILSCIRIRCFSFFFDTMPTKFLMISRFFYILLMSTRSILMPHIFKESKPVNRDTFLTVGFLKVISIRFFTTPVWINFPLNSDRFHITVYFHIFIYFYTFLLILFIIKHVADLFPIQT